VTGVESILARSADLGVPLEPSGARKVAAYAEMLSSRGVGLGVISAGDAARALERHVLDSLRAAAAAEPGDELAYDLGSGGGLPGIPVAVALPHLEIRLVEVRRLRAAWLELVIEQLGLHNASVVHGRIEDLTEPADLCFARALGSIERSMASARPVLRAGGRLVYFAGRGFDPADHPEILDELRILDDPDLESSGPLVIIGRQ